jgi:hypothetical protein
LIELAVSFVLITRAKSLDATHNVPPNKTLRQTRFQPSTCKAARTLSSRIAPSKGFATPPALPCRYPGNFIGEGVSFAPRFPIPKRENFGFVTSTHAALGTLWHRCRVLIGHSGFSAHRRLPVIHSRMYAGQFVSAMLPASQRLRKLTTS